MSTPIPPPVRPLLLAAALLTLALWTAPVAAQAGDGGLRWNPSELANEGRPLPHWQGRLGLAAAEEAPGVALDTSHRVLGASLMGDYFFSAKALSSGGGFRATGGLLMGSRNPLWSGAFGATQLAPGLNAERRDVSSYSLAPLGTDADAGDGNALTYVGLGYTGLFGKRPLTGIGWGFSADLGLMTLSPRSAVRLGNAGYGQPSATELVRDLQLNPMLHLGVSYAF
jgi:hypothetical protein